MTMTNETGFRNGVDTNTLFATLDAVKEAPEAAKFQFRASNRWLSATHSRGTMHGYFGVEDSWADFLANAIVTTAQVKLPSGNSLLTDVAEWIRSTINAWTFSRP